MSAYNVCFCGEVRKVVYLGYIYLDILLIGPSYLEPLGP